MDMETKYKSFIIGFGSFISWVVGGIGLAFTVLLAMMAIDFITGMMVGSLKNGGLKSSVGKEGLIKKASIILLICACYLMQILALSAPNTFVGMSLAGNFADGVCIAFSIIEFVSIVENTGKLGVRYPKIITDKIAALRDFEIMNEKKEGL